MLTTPCRTARLGDGIAHREGCMSAHFKQSPTIPRWLVAVVAVALSGLALTLCHRAIVLSDEGYLLKQAEDLLHGSVMYRDLDAFVTPALWFLIAALFAVVEPSVLITRGLATVCYLATATILCRIVRQTADERHALGAVCTYAVLTVWAFPGWTLAFYSPYSILFALVGLDRLLAWQENARAIDCLVAGLAIGLSIAFKQNFGVFAGVGIAVGIVGTCWSRTGTLRDTVRSFVVPGALVLLGIAIVAAPFLAYLVRNDAAGDAFHALVVMPFSDFASRHSISYLGLGDLWTDTLMEGPRRLIYGAYALSNSGFLETAPSRLLGLASRLHVILYLFPPALFVAAGAFLARSCLASGRLDVSLLAIVAVAGMTFLGVFPRADLNHLLHVYPPLVVLAAVLGQRLLACARNTGAWWPATVRTATIALIAPYTLVGAWWYVGLMNSQNSRITESRGGVLVDSFNARMIDYEVQELRNLTMPDEPVLTLPALTMLNFIADRPVSSRYYNLYAVHISHDRGASAAEEVERRGVRWAVADRDDFFSDVEGMRDYAPVFTEYLRRTFEPAFMVGIDKHSFLRRREHPLGESSPVDIRSACDLVVDAFATRNARRHILYDSIYHMFGTGRVTGTRTLDTVCALHVPPASSLTFMFGYRSPQTARSGSALTVSIWALPTEALDRPGIHLPEVLGTTKFAPLDELRVAVASAPGLRSPPPTERSIDLSAIAGKDVLLLLRTQFDGDVETDGSDPEGFAAAIHDLRIAPATGANAAGQSAPRNRALPN
jgi:hypothetical protein